MIVALEILPSLGVDYLLIAIKYVLRSGVSLNDWPMVMIILLFNICCPTSFPASKKMGVSGTSRCSTEDGKLTHSMDQDGFRIVATSYCTSCIFSSFCNSWTIFTIGCLNLFSF